MNENETDDSLRYIESLQKYILTEGYEEIHKHEIIKAWAQDNIHTLKKILEIYPNIDHDALLEEHRSNLEKFEPETSFDSFYAKSIFQPLIEEITKLAKRLNIELTSEINFANSTSISVTPFGRPASGNHSIFIGMGTSSFCNYWSKAFSSIAAELGMNGFIEKFEKSSFEKIVKSNPNVLMLPMLLTLHYAYFGTLIGFGKADTKIFQEKFRIDLLKAMEVFIVAHEFIHCVAEDYWTEYQGFISEEKSKELELKCDSKGFILCSLYGGQHSNWMAQSGAAPIIFFRAFNLCEEIRLLINQKHVNEDTHPPFAERIVQIQNLAVKTSPKTRRAAVTSYLEDVTSIFDELESSIKLIISKIIAGH